MAEKQSGSRNGKERSRLVPVLAAVLAAVFLCSAGLLCRELMSRRRDQETVRALAELAGEVQQSDGSRPSSPGGSGSREEPEPDADTGHKRDIAALQGENGDCEGWLSIAGTAVDYPVMYTPKSPQKYLRRDFYGKYSISGVPFLDGRGTPEDDNRVIYGHNMKNGTMFSDVTGYAQADFWAEHPTFEYETAQGCDTYTVFAAAAVQKDDPWYDFFAASDEEEYDGWIRYLAEKSLYSTGVTPEYGQKLLTLSTCWGADKAGRLIVAAVRLTG